MNSTGRCRGWNAVTSKTSCWRGLSEFQGGGPHSAEFRHSSADCHGWGFHSSAIDNADHDTLWPALWCEVRQPGAHAPWLLVSAIGSVEVDIDIFVSSDVTSTSSLEVKFLH